MAVKQTGQLGFGEASLAARGRNSALERVKDLVDWRSVEALLSGLRDEGPGRPAYPPLVMVRALLLQAWHGLSDPELEIALNDRLSFARFAGLSLEEPTPDHSTICRFRNRLVAAGLVDRLFAELDRQLEANGLILKRGTMLDATLLPAAPSKPAKGAKARDPDAAFAKRQSKPGSTYGYKAHVGVDQGSGLIRVVLATPANINDTTPADQLIRGDERIVWADAAYHTHARETALKKRGVKPRLMRRPNKHHPVLPPRLARFNKLISRRRAAVETTFATLKNRMRLTRIRYLGLAKAAGQITLVAIAFNLKRAAALTG
jgi:IS5 family transposase